METKKLYSVICASIDANIKKKDASLHDGHSQNVTVFYYKID